MLVDADRQGTASNRISDRNQNTDLPKIHSIQKFDNIHETLSDLAKRYEYVLWMPQGATAVNCARA